MISTDPRLKQLDTEFMTIDYILDECLFPQTSSGGMIPKTVKCQSDGSRFAAFSFLEESARGEPDILRHVIMKTRKHFERGKGRRFLLLRLVCASFVCSFT